MLKLVLQKILKAYGWKKLLKMAWETVQDDLQAAAKKTDTKIDDKIVQIVDGLIDVITTEDKAA